MLTVFLGQWHHVMLQIDWNLNVDQSQEQEVFSAKRAYYRGIWPSWGGLFQGKLNWDLKEKLVLPDSGRKKKQRRELGNLRATVGLENWHSQHSWLPELVRWELNWSGWQEPGHSDEMVSPLTAEGSHGGALEGTLNCSWTVVSDQIGQRPAWLLMVWLGVYCSKSSGSLGEMAAAGQSLIFCLCKNCNKINSKVIYVFTRYIPQSCQSKNLPFLLPVCKPTAVRVL